MLGSRTPRDLLLARALTLAPVVLAIPLGALAHGSFGVERRPTADGVAWAYSLGLAITCTTAFWPLAGLREWDAHRRRGSAALYFLGISYVTHLTWELGWLVAHDSIASSPDALWAYPWWAYIDGGDDRYRTAPPELIAMEILSVLNGIAGAYAFWRFRRSRGRDARAIAIFAASATVHFYSASLYFLTEFVSGMPSVDTTRASDLWAKFVLANAPWVAMPPVVWRWAAAEHRRVRDDVPALLHTGPPPGRDDLAWVPDPIPNASADSRVPTSRSRVAAGVFGVVEPHGRSWLLWPEVAFSRVVLRSET